MTIRDEITAELLSGQQDPQAGGLLDELKKALAGRVLDSDLEPSPGRGTCPVRLYGAA